MGILCVAWADRRSLPGLGGLESDQMGVQNPYILYFPRSSSLSPSNHLRSSSVETRSDALAASFEFFSTISSTKIGQSTRSARASASDGRESMLITSPPRSSQMT